MERTDLKHYPSRVVKAELPYAWRLHVFWGRMNTPSWIKVPLFKALFQRISFLASCFCFTSQKQCLGGSWNVLCFWDEGGIILVGLGSEPSGFIFLATKLLYSP